MMQNSNFGLCIDLRIQGYEAMKLTATPQHFVPLIEAQPPLPGHVESMLCKAWQHPGFEFNVCFCPRY